MIQFQQDVESPAQIAEAAARLRQAVLDREITPDEVLTIFEAWAKNLDARELDEIPGIVFLRIWLRRGTLEPIIVRELGSKSLHGGWNDYGRAQCKAYPLGVIGHWPAANVKIQPILSMTCALLGGNAALVRIPSDLNEVTRILVERLADSDPDEILMRRIFLVAFDHGRRDLQEAMAKSVDGAMIWGGREAVLQVRSLPFPHWARGHGRIWRNARPGAVVLLAMCGSSTSRRAPLPRSCSSKKIRPTPLRSLRRFCGGLLKMRTARTRGKASPPA
jgi:hypothetical protein